MYSTEALPVKNVALSRARVSIKPYISPVPNLGLEKYHQALFDGARQRDCVVVDTNGKIKTYLTGLNELSSDIQSITNADEKRARIMDIRQFVARLENEIASNFTVNAQDCMKGYGTGEDTFWQRVTMFKSVIPDTFDNNMVRIPTYWDDLYIELDNDGKALTMTDINHELIVRIVEAGGFSLVAKSLQDCISTGQYKFYLDKIEDSSKITVSKERLRNNAGTLLESMYAKDSNRLFYVTKLITAESLYIKDGKNGTPLEVMYDECSKFLNGDSYQKSKVLACEEFIKLAEKTTTLEELKIRAIIKDATSLRLLSYKADGYLYYIKFNQLMGKTVEDVAMYLKDPLNETTYQDILFMVEEEWKN